ncbi:POLG [Cordylochernes scorpioides]|uniref:DNA-directed DNA polymerase n=1 Tax=Cordylochernes scorpioides TaxID=51811 RepID=A0ABY6L1I8_9ARAC|nr:POLG [Cordylochernes scorpioides]
MHRRDGDQLFSHIVTGDESWVHHSTPETKQQSMVWKKPEESAPKKAKVTISAGKVMAIVFWDCKGVLLVGYLSQTLRLTLRGGTAFGWMTLQGSKEQGTDLHSQTANSVGISRNQAKILNYARIYGAGRNHAERQLLRMNHNLSKEEAKAKANKMYDMTKGRKLKHYMEDGTFGVPLLDEKTYRPIMKSLWSKGSESHMFNKLEEIAQSPHPTTPVLGCHISRALEPVAVDQSKDRVGSELKSMVQAPDGHHLVGADVDSQELWIAAILGDSHFTQIHVDRPQQLQGYGGAASVLILESAAKVSASMLGTASNYRQSQTFTDVCLDHGAMINESSTPTPHSMRSDVDLHAASPVTQNKQGRVQDLDAFQMLTVAYGEATLDRSNVYRWYKMFSEGREDVNDEERAGRPKTSTTDEKINEVGENDIGQSSNHR